MQRSARLIDGGTAPSGPNGGTLSLLVHIKVKYLEQSRVASDWVADPDDAIGRCVVRVTAAAQEAPVAAGP